MDATGLCRCMVELAGRAALLPSSKLGSARASKGEGGDYRGEATASRLASTVCGSKECKATWARRPCGGQVSVEAPWPRGGEVIVEVGATSAKTSSRDENNVESFSGSRGD